MSVSETGLYIDDNSGLLETGGLPIEELLFSVTPPVTTLSPDPGAYLILPSITLTSNRPAVIHYSINNGIDRIYSGPVHLIGECSFKYYSIDLDGNAETPRTVNYSLDRTLPVSSVHPNPGTFAVPQVVSIVTSKTEATIMYQLNGGGYNVYAGPFEVDVTTIIDYYAFDIGGNVELGKIATYTIDIIPPVTSINPPEGIILHAFDMVLSSNEPSTIRYALDGGTEHVYTMPVHITANTVVTFYGTDTVGNVEAVQTATYVFDTVTPITHISPLPGLYGAATDITITTSKIGNIFYSINNGPLQEYSDPFTLHATSTIAYHAVDLAGNIEPTKHSVYQIDLTVPVTTLEPDSGLFTAPVTVRMFSTKPGKSYYNVNDTGDVEYIGPFTIDATSTISYYSVDLLNHVEVTRSVLYVFDTTPPVTTANLASGTYWYKQPTLVVLDNNESGSTFYSINGGPDQVYTGPVQVIESCNFTYWSVDLSGNIETPQVLSFNIIGDGYYDYTTPIVLNNDATINYYLDFGDGTVEKTHSSHYVIDLFPLVVSGAPSSRTYRHIEFDFSLNKPGSVMYSINGSPFMKWHHPITLPDGDVELKYYGTSELRVYPIVTRNYHIDPNAVFVDIHPSPISVYQQPTFLVTLEARL